MASSNYNEDIKISFENLKRQSEGYRKIRNTLRFLLGNLNPQDIESEFNYNNIPDIEKFVLNRLYELNDEVNNFYEEFNFNKVYQIVLNFCNSELSSFFLM